jgi:hypothetical protein
MERQSKFLLSLCMHRSTGIGDGYQNLSLDQSSRLRAERSRLALKTRTKGTVTYSDPGPVDAVGIHNSDPQVGDIVSCAKHVYN